MQDLVALGTGNSRLMKSNISPSTTLSELISMLNNGTFPYDIGPLNAAGISQQGTALNKANLLTDATASLIGLPSDATPNDAFQTLRNLVSTAQSTADGRARITTGSYTGSAEYNDSNWRVISLGFQPKAVLVEGAKGRGPSEIGLALNGYPYNLGDLFGGNYTYYKIIQVISSGFQIRNFSMDTNAYSSFNTNNLKYNYIAFR